MALPEASTPLRRVLHEEGRKQSWLAERVGISEAQMSYIVGGYVPAEATRQAIADALGRTVTELWPSGSPTVAA